MLPSLSTITFGLEYFAGIQPKASGTHQRAILGSFLEAAMHRLGGFDVPVLSVEVSQARSEEDLGRLHLTQTQLFGTPGTVFCAENIKVLIDFRIRLL